MIHCDRDVGLWQSEQETGSETRAQSCESACVFAFPSPGN